MKAVRVLLCLLTAAWAWPLEGRWASSGSSAGAVSTPPKPPPACPVGNYRNSLIIWYCVGAGGRVYFFMQPKVAEPALEIPAGALDVSINASAENKNVDFTLLLADAQNGRIEVARSGTAPVERIYKQMQITVTGHQQGSPGTSTLRIKGRVTSPLTLKFKSRTEKWETLALTFTYGGIASCTTRSVPIGCSKYDLSAATGDVKAWSNWMRANHADAAEAWDNIAASFWEGSGRRLAANGQTAVPWYKWSAVWAQWPQGQGQGGGWQEAFYFLDSNMDSQITFDEFSEGWDSGDNQPLLDPSPSPATVPVATAPPSPSQQPAGIATKSKDTHATPGGQRTPSPQNDLEARHDITPGADDDIPSGGGGGLPNFLPVWLIWAVPLLALVCLCVRFFARDSVRLPYHHVPKSEPLPRNQPPLHADRWNPEYRHQAGAGPPSTVVKPEDKLPAPGGGATQTQLPPEGVVQSQNLRACDEGWARWGLLDCGLRGSKGAAGNPAKSGGMREPERQGQVLPPVLAWRGPDESQEEDEILQIIRAMRSEPQNEFVQESSCERLEDMALNPGGRKKIAELGGITEIVRAMHTHPASSAVQENGCGALGNEALSSERFQKIIANEGGIQAILRAMNEHQGSPAVQEKACWALQQLAMTQDNRLTIKEDNGVDLITAAMHTHEDSEAVQEHGCMAIGNLAYDVETRRTITVDGALDAMVRAMNLYPHVKVLQENACFALHNLACSDEAMKPIIDAGGIEAIVQAMKEHRLEAGVQENAINALHNINCGPISHVHKVVDLDGITLIVSAMQSHTVAGLQAKGCHVLGQLGDRDDEVRHRIQHAGGFSAITSAQTRFPNSKEVQQASREATAILTH